MFDAIERLLVMKTREETRAHVFELSTKTWSLAAMGALFEGGLVDHLTEPRSIDELAEKSPGMARARIEGCLGLLRAAGVVASVEERFVLTEGVRPFVAEPARSALIGEIRSALMQALAFVDSAAKKKGESGWRHVDRTLLDAQGAGSGAFSGFFRSAVVPSLGDLGARLERPGARFLDIGVGVARLAISLCRTWPEISVVGLDPFETPLAIARENVAAAKLDRRIELRRMGIEQLQEENAFDAVWLPVPFVPQLVLGDAIARAHAALKPDGWLLMAVLGREGSGEQQAAWAMMNALWGGPTLTKQSAIEAVSNAGFSEVKPFDMAMWGPILIAARR
jgi:SAM-dependent methyltransferase